MNVKKKQNALVSKDSALRVKAIRKESREVDFIASTEAVDSHHEVIDQESWNRRSPPPLSPSVAFGRGALRSESSPRSSEVSAGGSSRR